MESASTQPTSPPPADGQVDVSEPAQLATFAGEQHGSDISIDDAIWASLNLDKSSLHDDAKIPIIPVEPLIPLVDAEHDYNEDSWIEAIHESIESYSLEMDNLNDLIKHQQESNKLINMSIDKLQNLSNIINDTEKSINKLQHKNDTSLKVYNSIDVSILHLSEFIDQLFIKPKLIRHIIDGKVDDQEYSQYLEELSKKTALVEMHRFQHSLSYTSEIKHVINDLITTAIIKIRKFLIAKIDLLKRPNTNVNIIKENVLLPYRNLVDFIEQHAAHVFKEIKNMYVEIMSKTYYVLFKKYIAGLLTMKQILPSEYGNTLVGSLSSSSATSSATDRFPSLWGSSSSSGSVGSNMNNSGASISGSKTNINVKSAGVTQFSIGDRLNVLRDVEGPAIVLATAVDNNERFFYEQIHRSIGKMLSETCTSEHIFCDKFFGESNGRMFDIFFKRIIGFILDEIKQHTNITYDTLGILLALKINEAQRSGMLKIHKIKDLLDYFIQVDIILKPKFKKLFDENIQSLINTNTYYDNVKNSSLHVDCNPHIVTRRFSEFIASLLQISKYGIPDDSVLEGLRRLRYEYNNFLNYYSKLFTRPKPRYTFLVNNIDHVLTVLRQKAITSNTDDYKFFSEMSDVHIAAYVEHEVADHFPDIISFVRQYERTMKVINAHAANSDRDSAKHATEHMRQKNASESRVKAVLRQFASNWRLGVQHMQDSVLREFPNYDLGTDLIRSLFSRLLAYHKRCDAAIRETYPDLVGDVVPSSDIVQELKERASKV